MNPINFTIENLDAVLTTEDKAYCDKLFRQYDDLQNLVLEIFVEGNEKICEYNEANSHPFAEEVKTLVAHLKNIFSLRMENTRALVRSMETYFELKYSLENKFPSLLKSKSYKLDALLTDYKAVIANMINETDMDFSKGKP